MITEHRWTAGHTALAVGMLVSALMQIAYSWPHGWVRTIAGLAAVAVIPAGMHLWHHIPITGNWTRAARATAVSGVVLAAMTVNGAHAVILLTSRGEHIALAALIVIAVESLMVMASLATRAHPNHAAADVDLDDLDLIDLIDPPEDDIRNGRPAPDRLSRLQAEHVEAMRARLEEITPRDRIHLVPTIRPEAPEEPAPTVGGDFYARTLAAYSAAVENGTPPEVTPEWIKRVAGGSPATVKRVKKKLLDEIERAGK